MKREQTPTEKKREKRWNKRICIKGKQKLYVQEIKKEKGFKTEAGTLDYIINEFKKTNRK